MTVRHRRLFGFFVLTMLLYGSYGSVEWEGPWTCRIDIWKWSKTLRTITPRLRAEFEWLKRHRYLTEYESGRGWVRVTLRPPPARCEA